MEHKTTEKFILKKPKGKVEVYASFGQISWGTDKDGICFVKWNQEKWVPADPRKHETVDWGQSSEEKK